MEVKFDELLAHGRSVVPESQWVNGMPWAFQYDGFPVTHENDNCYLVCTPTETIRVNREEA